MPLFAVIGLDDAAHSVERRLASQQAHRAYVPGNDADIAMVGALIGDGGAPCGSFYLFDAESEQAVRDWLGREPYVQSDVYERLEVRPFLLGKNRLPARDWPSARPADSSGGRSGLVQDTFDKEESYRIARGYFAAVTAGDLRDDQLTPDMTAWITTGGTIDKATYQNMIRLLAAMCATPLRFTIQALTADGDRVVAEATSVTTLINGEEYRQSYVFVLRIRDGRIASVAEHYNALISQEKLMPLMAEAAARLARGH